MQMKLKEIGVSVLETTSAGSIASVAASLFTPTSDGQPAVIRRTKKKQNKNPSIYDSANPKYKNIQVKGKDPIPAKSKPTAGHQSPHPFRGKLVGEGDMEADREAGIKWVDNPDWKRLHEMNLKMVKDFLDHKESVSEQPAAPDAGAMAGRAQVMKRDTGSKASGTLTARAFAQVASGKALPPNLIQAIKPYTDAVQKIMVDPKLFARFRALVKLSNAGSGDTAVGRKLPPKVVNAGLDEATVQRQHLEVIADIIGSFPGNAKVRMDFMNHAIKELPKYNDQFKDKIFIARVSQAVKAAKDDDRMSDAAKRHERQSAQQYDASYKSRAAAQTAREKESMIAAKARADAKLGEKAPPGRERQVKALKGKVDNPYAVSWGSYNKSKGKK
jgi:hypothetical protein